jgi:phosphatidylserine decarboxylase
MIDSLISSIRKTVVPVHREARPFLLICAVAALILFVLSSPFAWLAVLLGLWVAYFFRDPVRVTPVAPGLVVSGADGRVSAVAEAVPPPELGLGDRPLPRVSVFMNVFDVHVNRAPVSGRIARIAYRPGAFLNADLDKASEDNERNGFRIETDAGATIGVVQIAGLVARRIVCFVREGEAVVAGDRIGLIRFGSRVDHYLPPGTRPLVTVGQTAIAGETVIADLGADRAGTAERTYRVS